MHEEVKVWLQRYGEMIRNANCLYDRLDVLQSRLRNPHASNLDGMPHATGFVEDRTGAAVAQIDALEREAEKALAQATAARHEIEAAIAQIKGRGWPDQRCVLRCRYIDCMSWEDIAMLLFGDREDFLEREDTFIRRAFRVHKDALVKLATIVPLEQGQENDKETE